MRLRLLTSIVMTLAIGLAPTALDVCQAACPLPTRPASTAPAAHDRGHAQHAPTTAHQHAAACHEAMASHDVAAAKVNGLPHSCSHAGELPESSGACSPLPVLSPGVFAATVDLAGPTLGRLPRFEPLHASVSLRIALNRQLRV